MRLTALWWWIDRWRKSTAYTDMTLEQQGAYRNLLDEATLRGGPLPNDEHVLAKACGDPRRWTKVRPQVLKHFTLYPDGWRNTTLDEVLRTSEEIRATRAASGRRGAQQRWQTHDKPDGKPDSKPDDKPLANGMAPDPDPIVEERSLSGSTGVLEKPPQSLAADDIVQRAGRLLQLYAALYPKYRRGARLRLIGNSLEFEEARSLVETWDDARLEKLAIIVLESDDAFIAKTDRSFRIFALKATWADDRLKAWEHAHGVTV